MKMSEIPRDIPARFEKNPQQELDMNNDNWITGLLKKRNITLRVVQTVKRVRDELDEVRGR